VKPPTRSKYFFSAGEKVLTMTVVMEAGGTK